MISVRYSLGCTLKSHGDWHTKYCDNKFWKSFVKTSFAWRRRKGKVNSKSLKFYNAPSNRKCINRLIPFKAIVLCHFAVIVSLCRSSLFASISWSNAASSNSSTRCFDVSSTLYKDSLTTLQNFNDRLSTSPRNTTTYKLELKHS